MTVRRLVAIALIYLGTSAAWTVLGSSLIARTGQFDRRLEREVQLMWGGPHRQVAPDAWVDHPDVETEVVETTREDGQVVQSRINKPILRAVPAALESTRATVDLDLEHRRRGLLWYPSYTVDFAGTYTFRNPEGQERTLHVRFPLPARDALFDDVLFEIDGQPAPEIPDVTEEMTGATIVDAAGLATLAVRYRSRGLSTWTYSFVPNGAAHVRDFNLRMHTNFDAIDYPAGTVSPGETLPIDDGRQLTWSFSNLITGQAIGMELPNKLNPGPFAARVTFFAPVSLLFFLAVMVLVGVTKGPSLHPMHYWFIAAAFFAFHLLLAYLVDQVAVPVAFTVAAAVSLALVISYLRVVTGIRHALLHAGAAQLVFLVMFSYAFFFEGFTGLSITIGAVLTLFVMMQITARVSWDEVFGHGPDRGGRPVESLNVTHG